VGAREIAFGRSRSSCRGNAYRSREHCGLRLPRVKVLGSIVWVALPLLTGAIGGIASKSAPTFYAQLVKPEWAPPPWLFGPVWTALYLLMGIAALLV
jgi:hypothetical protein